MATQDGLCAACFVEDASTKLKAYFSESNDRVMAQLFGFDANGAPAE